MIDAKEAFRWALQRRTPRLIATPLLLIGMVGASSLGAGGLDPLQPGALGADAWRVLVAGLLHGDLWALSASLGCLLVAGPILERLIGAVGLSLVFGAGVVLFVLVSPAVVAAGGGGTAAVLGGLIMALLFERGAVNGLPRAGLERSLFAAILLAALMLGLRRVIFGGGRAELAALGCGGASALSLYAWRPRWRVGVSGARAAAHALALAVGVCLAATPAADALARRPGPGETRQAHPEAPRAPQRPQPHRPAP